MFHPLARRIVRPRTARAVAAIALSSAAFISAPSFAQQHSEIVLISPSEIAALDNAFSTGQPALPDTLSLTAIQPIFDDQAVSALTEPDQGEALPSLDEYGPPDSRLSLAEQQQRPTRPYASFGADVAAIKWEFAAVAAYYTAINAPKLFMNPQAPRFHREGWFGESTHNLGVDKLAHAYSAYVISELLYARLKRNTGDAPGIQYTAAALASGVMLWTEAFDSIEPDGGWSWEDVAMNTAGAAFSVVRNSVPGLDEKLDYRLMIEPNSDIYTTRGKEHFQQQRYFFALKLSGFDAFDRSPLRFLEVHAGYHGDDFLNSDREAGVIPKRHLFVGLGINLRELLFKNSRSRVGRAAGEILDYFQLPYTAVHQHITD